MNRANAAEAAHAATNPPALKSAKETAAELQEVWQARLRLAKQEGRGRPSMTSSSPVFALFPDAHRLIYDWQFERHDSRLYDHEHDPMDPVRDSTWSFLILHPEWSDDEGVFFHHSHHHGGDFVYATYATPTYRDGKMSWRNRGCAWILEDLRRVARRHFR